MTDPAHLDTGIVDIRGKQYKTVARRIAEFREVHPDYSIQTDLLDGGDRVLMKATISHNGIILATGYAEENREWGINKTSAIENCETSCVGRALGFMSYGGSHIASAEEIERALAQQEEHSALEYLVAHNNVLRDNLESVLAIKAYLVTGNLSGAKECWHELTEEEQTALWVAPTKGGIFTTEERKVMKSGEWGAA